MRPILVLIALLSGCTTVWPQDLPNRAGVVCPEGFDDSIEFEVIEAPTRYHANKTCRPFLGNLSPIVEVRGCMVDFGEGRGRLVVYAKHDYATKDEELAHAACPSGGYDSLALDISQANRR